MKTFKNIIIVIVFALFTMSFITSCGTMEKLGEYFQENPVITSLGARQAVVRYIDKGSTEQDKKSRAIQMDSGLNLILVYMNGNLLATADSLIDVVNNSFNWDNLSRADKMLIQDIIIIMKNSLLKGHNDKTLTPETMLSIRELLSVMRSAAALFL